MNQKAEFASALLSGVPWKAESNALWPFTLFIARRNLAKYHFPSKMNRAEGMSVLDSLTKAISSLPSLANGYFLKKQDLNSLDKELLLEHFLFFKTFQEGSPESIEGSALFLDPSLTILSTINMGNHLELRVLDSKGDLETAWGAISKLENGLGAQFDFAFSSKFGFLTSDPEYCGTGLTILAFLHLPALIHTGQLQEILTKQNDESLSVHGLSENPNEFMGDIAVIQNNYALGMNEENIARSVQSMATKLIGSEKKGRATLKNEGTDKFKDKISKAYGLLTHSYELEVAEGLNLLSLIKLGLDLGWIKGVEEKKLNELFFKIRRGHLTHLFPGIEDLKKIAHKRAEFLHAELQGMQLNI